MGRNILVEKQSGEKEPFSPEKLRESLKRSGAPEPLIDEVEEAMKSKLVDGITTSIIYREAFQLLRRLKRSTAARYSLKKAIMELGPSGYPFEHFVGAVLEKMGYEVKVGQVVQGHCVQHEVDVVARNAHEQFMVECKFYNNQGKYCNVQVPLYIDSRFKDIEKRWRLAGDNMHLNYRGWVVTNTRFTSDAMDYGRCVGLHLVSWDYPRRNSLKDMIEQSGLFPVTVLTSLQKRQKQQLLDAGIVLCRQLKEKPGVLDTIGLTKPKLKIVMKELDEVINR
jgi:hypothetical protein